MRIIDRCLLGMIALGVWGLVGAIVLAPQPARSQNAAMDSFMAMAAQQISRLDCKFDGTAGSGGRIVGDLRCHL